MQCFGCVLVITMMEYRLVMVGSVCGLKEASD